MSSRKKYLVTGGTGFIGSALVRVLIAGAMRSAFSTTIRVAQAGALPTLLSALKGIVNILDACGATGVSELFVASSWEVYKTPPRIPTDEAVPLVVPDPLNPRYSYGGGKIISELLALNFGIRRLSRVVIFRPHNVFGPDKGTVMN